MGSLSLHRWHGLSFSIQDNESGPPIKNTSGLARPDFSEFWCPTTLRRPIVRRRRHAITSRVLAISRINCRVRRIRTLPKGRRVIFGGSHLSRSVRFSSLRGSSGEHSENRTSDRNRQQSICSQTPSAARGVQFAGAIRISFAIR